MQLDDFGRTLAREMDKHGLSDVIGGSEHTIAACEELFAAVSEYTQIKPDMSILDFGSGCGRLAVPMMQFLSDQGSFTGIDIIPRLVEFSNRKIASHYENCQFFLSADQNKLYDKFMDSREAEFLPGKELDELAAQSFDVIVAFSVFTHLTNAEAADYLQKLKRLLKPNGRMLISCFLINESSRQYLKDGKSHIPFPDDVFTSKDVYYLAHDGELTAVAYEEGRLQQLAIQSNLEPVLTYHGHWCGRPIRNFYQDLIVLAPSPELPQGFDPERYLQKNPDLQIPDDEDPIAIAKKHYLIYGIPQGDRKSVV